MSDGAEVEFKLNNNKITNGHVNLSVGVNKIEMKLSHSNGLSTTYKLDVTRKQAPVVCPSILKSIKLEVRKQFNFQDLLGDYKNNVYREMDNTEIAEISDKGIITAKKVGKTSFQVRINGGWSCVETVEVEVVKSSDPSKIMHSTDIPLSVDESMNLGNKDELKKYSNLKWASSNSNIVEVDSKGVIKAKAVGDATITASNDEVLYTVNVKVYEKKTPPDLPGGKQYGYLLTDDENNEVSADELDESSEENKKAKAEIEDLNKVKTIEVEIKNEQTRNIIVFYIPDDFDKEKIAVYRLENGKYVRVDAELINGEIRLKDSKAGVYAIAELNTKTNIPENGTITSSTIKDVENPQTGIKLPTALVIVGYLAVVGLIIFIKNKNKLSKI